jgi:hypothetical protein
MEVHHPHHPTHKKKWSEYIIEFVMLFTAVTLGFFAENIREGIAEKHKKQELLAAVVRDFKTDKEELNMHRELIKQRIDICDDFTKYLQEDYRKVNKIDFYRTAILYATNKDIVLNEKSRNDAEAKGYFTDINGYDLSPTLNKFNYHINDYKVMNNGVLEYCKRFLSTYINDVLDPNLILKTDFLWLENVKDHDPRFNGNLDHPVDKKVSDKIIFEIWFKKNLLKGELRSFDSLDLYANKAIGKLQNQDEVH